MVIIIKTVIGGFLLLCAGLIDRVTCGSNKFEEIVLYF